MRAPKTVQEIHPCPTWPVPLPGRGERYPRVVALARLALRRQ